MARPLEGVILDTVTNDRVKFYSFEPPRYSRVPVYEDVAVRGRSQEHQFYSHTTAGIWSFAIKFAAAVDQFDDQDLFSPSEGAAFIESLVVPDYGTDPGNNAAVVQPPHLARVAIKGTGGFMLDAIGTIRSFDKILAPPYDVIEGLPHNIDVTFSLKVTATIVAPSGPGRVETERVDGYADVRRFRIFGQDRIRG